MLSLVTIVSRHLSEDLLGLRVCSGVGTTSSCLTIFVIVDLKIITLSYGLVCFAILSIRTCFRVFGTCYLIYVVVSVVVDGMHVPGPTIRR